MNEVTISRSDYDELMQELRDLSQAIASIEADTHCQYILQDNKRIFTFCGETIRNYVLRETNKTTKWLDEEVEYLNTKIKQAHDLNVSTVLTRKPLKNYNWYLKLKGLLFKDNKHKNK